MAIYELSWALWQTQSCWGRADAHHEAISSSCDPNGMTQRLGMV